MYDQSDTSCVMCGGDGRIGNSFGSTKTCPGCGGSGRRQEDFGARDVTKTKSSQGRMPNGGARMDRANGLIPHTMSAEGLKLTEEVRACTWITPETKTKLTMEIAAYDQSHGGSTSTFSKKIRKQIRTPAK